MRAFLPSCALAAGLLLLAVPPSGVELAAPAPARADPAPADSPDDPRCGPLEPADYPWLGEMDVDIGTLEPLCARWSPPEGYRRVRLEPGSFGAWLRGLPVRTDRRTVRAHDGRTVRAASAGVVALDLLPGNVQQCADTVLRLHAEHAWHRGDAADVVYHFTSGDAVGWRDWVAGERYRIDGARVQRVRGAPRKPTRSAFRRWQRRVMSYAGTRSLHLDSEPVPPDARLRPGDFFVEAGAPGHAVVLLDVAHGADGERIALVGQGFMPAQELHVLRPGSASRAGGAWFRLPEAGDRLDTPGWRPFARDSARRF